MKEKIKNYIFCLCALAMCLAFALAVFLRASENVKASPIVLGSNISVNENQTLLSDTVSNRRYTLNINYSSSTYQFIVREFDSSSVNVYVYNYCNQTSSNSTTRIYTCNYLFYIGSLSSTSVAIDVSSNKPVITLSLSDIDNASDTITFTRLYYSTSRSSYYSNVVFSTTGTSFYEGYQVGYSSAINNTYNSLYYTACVQYSNSSNCPTDFFNKYLPIQPSISVVIDDLLNIYGLGYANKVPIDIYELLYSIYSSSVNESCLISSSTCVLWTSTDLTLSNLEFGINAIVNNNDIITYSNSYNTGYVDGRLDGIEVGVEDGKIIGYQQGFIDGQQAEDIVGNAVLSVASTPLMVLSGMLNFDILGFSVYSLVLALFTFLLVIYIIKKVFF